MPRSIAAALTLSTLLLLPALSRAGLPPDGQCEGTKLRGIARASAGWLLCHARAASAAGSASPACIANAQRALTKGFAVGDSGGNCVTTGGYEAVHDLIEGLAGDLSALLDTSVGKDRCAAGKLRAAANRSAADLLCRRRAAQTGTDVDEVCLEDAAADLAAAFVRLEERLVCLTSNDADDVETAVASFAGQVAAILYGTTDGPAPTGLAAIVSGGDIDLTWTNPPAESGLTQARVLRRLNVAPSSPDDPSATEVYEGPAQATADDLTALLPDTTTVARTYHYAVYGCTPSQVCETTGSHTTLTPTLVQALHAGGYTIHWRHASADVCSDRLDLGTAETTAVPNWWKSCDSDCGSATARQLNNTGRAEAAFIGDAFATRGIPVGRVVTSEFCRNTETASLMDFGPVPEESQDVTYFVYDEPNRCNDSYALLAQAPAPGTNTALIGHAGNTCTILSSLAWAEAAIFKPDGMGGSVFVQRVLANAWLALP